MSFDETFETDIVSILDSFRLERVDTDIENWDKLLNEGFTKNEILLGKKGYSVLHDGVKPIIVGKSNLTRTY